jgi:hypothetical protein
LVSSLHPRETLLIAVGSENALIAGVGDEDLGDEWRMDSSIKLIVGFVSICDCVRRCLNSCTPVPTQG